MNHKTERVKVFLSFSLCVLFAGCLKPTEKCYVLMEKQMADLPVSAGQAGVKGRKRTTAKIIIQGTGGSVQGAIIEEAMKQALEDLRKDDTELDAALLWAYRNRKELNQTFTLGKLEWSKDKKGWEGKQNLSEEIITEIR